MTTFWSTFIIVLVIVNVGGSIWLLMATSSRSSDDPEMTSHTWDEDLREYNKPLPRWWLNLFYLSAVFTIVYLVFYGGLGNYAGILGWSQQDQYEQELAAAEEQFAGAFASFAGLELDAMAKHPAALSAGRNIYMNFCSTCHGSDARGAVGFPNLADDDWLYGGDSATVLTTITNGRVGVMPALGAVLGDAGTDGMIAYIRHLAEGGPADDGSPARQQYLTFCSACHGPTGTGMAVLGAPNLTDNTWLHGSDDATIRDILTNGLSNQMPAQSILLSEERLRAVAAYVLSLEMSGE